MSFVPSHNPSFCPQQSKSNMQINTSGWMPKDSGCSRPCTCNECKLLYVDELTFAMKTRGEKFEDFVVDFIYVLCYPFLYLKAITNRT